MRWAASDLVCICRSRNWNFISIVRLRQGSAAAATVNASSMPKVHTPAALPEKLHALVVSTNRKTAEKLRGALAGLGYRVRASSTIAAGIRRFRLTSPDLLIIDAQLLEHRLPEDIVQRFHVWRRHGDHYHPAGPVARSTTHASGSATSEAINLALDPTDLTVHVGDHVATLTQTEFAILLMLLSHRGKAVTRDELLKHADTPFDRVIDRHICNIRHKIDIDPKSASLIETVRGIGYRIEP
jgi:DNA-binding response OmpR family regulator